MSNDKFVNELKDCLEIYYDEVHEFFWHACISEYDYKVFVARHSYVLYKIFLYLFNSAPEEVCDKNVEFKLKGSIYNSNAIAQLIAKFSENETSSKSKVLIMDDIIINGRTMTNIVEQLKTNKLLNDGNLKIWCINCYVDGKCIESIKKYFGHYRYVNRNEWEKLSDVLTKSVVCSNFGYISFVNSYSLLSNINIFDNLMTQFGQNKLKIYNNTNPYEKNCGIDSRVIFIKFKEHKKLKDYKIKSCIRLYSKNEKATIVPYVFLPTVEKKYCYDYCYLLLSQFNINIPKYYMERDKNKFAKSLYQWTIYKLSEILKYEFMNAYNIDEKMITNLFTSTESYMFDETINEINNNIKNQSSNITCFIVNNAKNDDLMRCKKEFEKVLINKVNSIEADISISFKVIKNMLEEYLTEMDVLDEKRATSYPNNYQRYKGIRLYDIYEIISYNTKNFDRIELMEKVIECVLSILDYGKATYIIDEIDTDNTTLIGGFIRHGEQIYRSYYELNRDVYNVFYEFFNWTYEFRKEKLIKIAEYFDEKYKTDRFTYFVDNIKDYNKYFYDLKAVNPDSLLKDNIIVKSPKNEVERYVNSFYDF